MASFGPTAQFDGKSNGELREFQEMSEAEFARYINTAAIKGQFLFRGGGIKTSAHSLAVCRYGFAFSVELSESEEHGANCFRGPICSEKRHAPMKKALG
jgi:hypothetical protein